MVGKKDEEIMFDIEVILFEYNVVWWVVERLIKEDSVIGNKRRVGGDLGEIEIVDMLMEIKLYDLFIGLELIELLFGDFIFVDIIYEFVRLVGEVIDLIELILEEDVFVVI